MPTSRSKNRAIGITLGDPAGIGAEVAAKALADPALRRGAHFTIIGDECLFRRYFSVRYKNCTFVDLGRLREGEFEAGQPSRLTGKASSAYLKTAVDLIKRKEISALVTAPVCKEAIAKTDPSFHGHTEFLARAFGVRAPGMMFVCEGLRVILVTRHIPLREVSAAVRPALVYETIRLAHEALRRYFRCPNPVVAVCGLNPHAGEGGTIGNEELRRIIPAIKKARQGRIRAEGPFPADTLFRQDSGYSYDAVVAMYHDQGLIPVKMLHFKRVVNLTVGLPFVRTSPAHGTAFDLAGKNTADASSMIEAVRLAVKLAG